MWVCAPQAAFGRLVLFLVALVVVLQGLHLLLLSRLDARQRKMVDPDTRAPRFSSSSGGGGGGGSTGNGHTEQAKTSLKDMVREACVGGVLDSSGEYRVVERLSHGWALPPWPHHRPWAAPGPSTTLTQDVTLVTQSSPNHLWNLLELAQLWSGPVSAAIFIPRRSEVTDTVSAIEGLRRCWPLMRANLTVHVVVPLNSGDSTPTVTPPFESCDTVREALLRRESDVSYSYDVPYPTNLLRNVARRNAQSEFHLVVDVDLVPSADLRESFLHYARDARLFNPTRRSEKTVYVLPAYESRSTIPRRKLELLSQVHAGDARPFYQELCWRCQANTDYTAWERDTGSVSPLFEVLWKDPWEPFHIARSWAPFYDERFRQYGFNRVSHACELHVAGWRFSVLGGNAFLVHRGWKTRDGFHAGKEVDQERNRMLFRQFKTELKERYPESSRRCY